MPTLTRYAVSALILTVIATLTVAEERTAKFESGQYEQLLLAVGTDGLLTGYYREEQGGGTTKTCGFYLTGRATGGDAAVETWSDRLLPGRLTVVPGGVRLQVDRGREHAGCGLVLLPEIVSGLELDRVADAAWVELRTVTAPRAYFHSSPDERQVLKAFVVNGDIVAVVARQGGWLQVEYRGKKRRTKGWIELASTSDLKLPTTIGDCPPWAIADGQTHHSLIARCSK
jgi:hypothetical protein